MHRFLAFLTSLSLLCPVAVRAASPVSLQASLQLLGDAKQNTNTVSRSRRALLRRSRAQNLRRKNSYRRVSMLNRAYNTYTNDTYGLTIGYPGDWKVLHNFMETVASFLSPQTDANDELTENINILVERYNPGQAPTLHEATQKALKQLRQLEGFTMHELNKNEILDQRSAMSMTYSAGNREQMLKFKQVWVLHEGSLYIFTFVASPLTFRDYVRVFDKMLGTLKLE
ncbi:hypothetical protein HYZ99_02325 [Candidatus Peregrinibacteria bacterium]|nr:hypothetical protein [Candidatus Peregrinibacteria bacterium]